MTPLEAELAYPFKDDVPPAGGVREIAPGVYWLRMGLPFALNHINLWLLQDVDGERGARSWTVVDCGIADDATRANWETIFAHHLGGAPITRVLATHCHPDHVGLADWLCRRWDAMLWMTAGEYGFARMMSAGLPGADGPAMFPHFQRHGLREDGMAERLAARRNYYPSLVPAMPEGFVRLQEGQAVRIGERDWQVIAGFGHSPEHAALYCASLGILLSGDMILPRISTNVSVFAIEPLANPLQLYLDALGKYAHLPADTLVLPAHGKPFVGLHARIGQLRAHHAARLDEVLQACGEAPQSAADIVPRMFARALDAHQLTFAMGEALAHLHKLWYDGALERCVGDDGIVRFSARR